MQKDERPTGNRVFIGGDEQDMNDAARIIYSDQFLSKGIEHAKEVEDVAENWLLETDCLEAHLNSELDVSVKRAIIEYNGRVCDMIETLNRTIKDFRDLRVTLNE